MILRIHIVLSVLIAIFSCSVSGQPNIQSWLPSGEIPEVFLKDLLTSVEQSEEQYLKDKATTKSKAYKAELILASALNYRTYYRNGYLLFGDEFTVYLNKIKDHLLANDIGLREKIEVFILKSSEVNAYSTLEGHIYISIGLLTRMETEAQIAFVISHEITHYTKKHLMQSAEDEAEIDSKRKANNHFTFDEMLKLFLKRKKEHEFEADSLGILLFAHTDYDREAIPSVLHILSRASLSLFQEELDPSFFNSQHFVVPKAFFKSDVDSLEDVIDQDDTYTTHPNIGKRLDAASRIISRQKLNGVKSCIVSESNFKRLKTVCLTEIPRVQLLHRWYTEALYTAYSLAKKDVDNEEYYSYLIAKALYGVARFKSGDAYYYISRGYTRVRGSSQSVYYLCKHLSPKQATALAINKVYEEILRFPNDESLKQNLKDLIFDLVIEHKVDRTMLWNKEQAQEFINTKYTTYIPEKLDNKASRNKYRDFYKSALAENLDDPLIIRFFSQALAERKRLEKRMYTSYKELEKNKKARLKRIKALGYEINADSLIVLSPEVTLYGDFDKNELLRIRNTTDMVTNLLRASPSSFSDKKIKYLSHHLASKDIDQYQEYVLARSLYNQYMSNHVNISPSSLMDYTNKKSLAMYHKAIYINLIYTEDKVFYIFNLVDSFSGTSLFFNYEVIPFSKGLLQVLSGKINSDFTNILH